MATSIKVSYDRPSSNSSASSTPSQSSPTRASLSGNPGQSFSTPTGHNYGLGPLPTPILPFNGGMSPRDRQITTPDSARESARAHSPSHWDSDSELSLSLAAGASPRVPFALDGPQLPTELSPDIENAILSSVNTYLFGDPDPFSLRISQDDYQEPPEQVRLPSQQLGQSPATSGPIKPAPSSSLRTPANSNTNPTPNGNNGIDSSTLDELCSRVSVLPHYSKPKGPKGRSPPSSPDPKIQQPMEQARTLPVPENLYPTPASKKANDLARDGATISPTTRSATRMNSGPAPLVNSGTSYSTGDRTTNGPPSNFVPSPPGYDADHTRSRLPIDNHISDNLHLPSQAPQSQQNQPSNQIPNRSTLVVTSNSVPYNGTKIGFESTASTPGQTRNPTISNAWGTPRDSAYTQPTSATAQTWNNQNQVQPQAREVVETPITGLSLPAAPAQFADQLGPQAAMNEDRRKKRNAQATPSTSTAVDSQLRINANPALIESQEAPKSSTAITNSNLAPAPAPYYSQPSQIGPAQPAAPPPPKAAWGNSGSNAPSRGSNNVSVDGSSNLRPLGEHENALQQIEQALSEKRRAFGRPDALEQMSSQQILDEKVAIQKLLLRYEENYGRPENTNSKNLMRPIYERYRALKRILSSSAHSQSPSGGSQPANTPNSSGFYSNSQSHMHVSGLVLSPSPTPAFNSFRDARSDQTDGLPYQPNSLNGPGNTRVRTTSNNLDEDREVDRRRANSASAGSGRGASNVRSGRPDSAISSLAPTPLPAQNPPGPLAAATGNGTGMGMGVAYTQNVSNARPGPTRSAGANNANAHYPNSIPSSGSILHESDDFMVTQEFEQRPGNQFSPHIQNIQPTPSSSTLRNSRSNLSLNSNSNSNSNANMHNASGVPYLNNYAPSPTGPTATRNANYNRADQSAVSAINSGAHNLPNNSNSYPDAVGELKRLKDDKQRLHRILRTFESEFERETGRKPEHNDRLAMSSEYSQYKRVKRRIEELESPNLPTDISPRA